MTNQRINNSEFITRESLEETIRELENKYKTKINTPSILSNPYYINQIKINLLYELKRKLEQKYKK